MLSRDESHPLLSRSIRSGSESNVSGEEDGESESDEGPSRDVEIHFKPSRKSNVEPEVGEELKMAVYVRVDKLTSIDLEGQTFAASLWVFIITAEKLSKEKRERVEKFLKEFHPEETPDQHWLSPQNLVDTGDATHQPKPDFLDEGERIGLTWKLSGSFAEAWELDFFPFDCQDLNVKIMFRYPAGDFHFKFVEDERRKSWIRDRTFPTLDRTWDYPERLTVWASHDKSASNRGGKNRQILNVTLQVRRNPWYYVYNIVVPIFLIVLMSGSSFVIRPKEIQDRLAASLTLVLTAVAYKYNVMQAVPPVGYLTWLDYYMLMCYVSLFLVVAENCWVYLEFEKRESDFAYNPVLYDEFRNAEFHYIQILSYIFFACNIAFFLVACRARWWPGRVSGRKAKKDRLPCVTYPDAQLSRCQSFSCGADDM